MDTIVTSLITLLPPFTAYLKNWFRGQPSGDQGFPWQRGSFRDSNRDQVCIHQPSGCRRKKQKRNYLWETPSVSDHKNTLDAQAKITLFHEIYFKYTMHSFLFNNFKRKAQTNLDNARNKSVIVAQDKTVGQIKPNT